MRKLMFALFVVMILIVAGCLKNDIPTYDCSVVTIAAPASEVAALKAYLDSNHISATQDGRGFFYNIDSSASTAAGHPTSCSNINVTYSGRLTDGKVIDSQYVQTPVTFGLYSNIITGWKEAIPLMKSNSTINLYLPPSLAYGSMGKGSVPGNANLIFNIKLLVFD